MAEHVTSKYVLISRDTANLIRGAFIPDNPRRMRTAHPDVRRAAEEFIAALAPGASSPPTDELWDILLKWRENPNFFATNRALRDAIDARLSQTKSEGPYGCIHDSSPTTWCGVCYPEKCTATETSNAPRPDPFASEYHELLLAVESKFPGESRHATALRYIRERERSCNGPAQSEPEVRHE